jgi:hypothetical protein
MPRKRDRTFLNLAIFAATGGVLAIATSVGAPLWSWWHGGHAEPTYFFFSLWGLAALAGAAANVYVYFQTGPPPEKPPRGGQRIATVTVLEARTASKPEVREERRAA